MFLSLELTGTLEHIKLVAMEGPQVVKPYVFNHLANPVSGKVVVPL